MAAAEDRQARALEDLARSGREMVKILATFNENFVASFKFLQEQVEKAEEFDRELAENPNQMSIDELRAKAEREEYESRTGETWVESQDRDPFEMSDKTRFSDGSA